MPTYTNTVNGIVNVDDYTFLPLETKLFYHYLDNSGGYLTLDSDEPYYNPILKDEVVTGTGETKEVALVSTSSSSIRLVPVSGSIKVYLNSVSNTPGMTLKESVTITNRKRITRIYLVFTGAGEVLFQENL